MPGVSKCLTRAERTPLPGGVRGVELPTTRLDFDGEDRTGASRRRKRAECRSGPDRSCLAASVETATGMNFHGSDLDHPEHLGHIFATCVVYATIYGPDNRVCLRPPPISRPNRLAKSTRLSLRRTRCLCKSECGIRPVARAARRSREPATSCQRWCDLTPTIRAATKPALYCQMLFSTPTGAMPAPSKAVKIKA